MGFRPIILDRGKVVRERTKDTWGLWRAQRARSRSNVQFGEGGAGTFSDGKLYSRIKDPRHLDRKVLTEFVKAGAPPEILTEAHPHIGTFRLVTMVEQHCARRSRGWAANIASSTASTASTSRPMRRATARVRGLHLHTGEYLEADHVVLAVGHSARRHLRHAPRRGGPCRGQALRDRRAHRTPAILDRSLALRRRCRQPDPGCGRISYLASLLERPHGLQLLHVPRRHRGRGDLEEGRVATNGMSQYSRNERNANSGFVVAIDPARDYPGDPLAGIAFQRHWESRAFIAGGSTYKAPRQRLGDFLAGRPSKALGQVIPSYRPGVEMADLADCLPEFAVTAMREALLRLRPPDQRL